MKYVLYVSFLDFSLFINARGLYYNFLLYFYFKSIDLEFVKENTRKRRTGKKKCFNKY